MVKSLNTEQFIHKAKKIHGDKYDYNEVNYVLSSKNVKIRCKKCGKKFEQTPANHLSGSGCPDCAKGVLRRTLKAFIEKAQAIHGDKYNYDDVIYVNIYTPVKIYCKKCKKYFLQDMHAHLRGNGCPNCFTSKGEEAIKRFLRENNIEFV